MSQDQIVNLVTKIIITVCAGFAAKYGIGAIDLSHLAALGATTIVGLATFIYSHKWNAEPKTDEPLKQPIDSQSMPNGGFISLKLMAGVCPASITVVSLMILAGCASFNADVFKAEQVATSSAQTATHQFNLYYAAQLAANDTNSLAKLNLTRNELYDADRKLSMALMQLEQARKTYVTNSTETNKTVVIQAMKSVSLQSSNIVDLSRKISK